ncbi:cell envelope integrity protein TolA [Colwellia sp. E2M01]|uniref:cell envelope integrity protein TolA n=1 Tax=Colwellia sp. E2M01 TaxID=2841561 RepID=UPI001C080C68|nr:cell envelope integrity protein TolA [Colwellia sp. E2M01]MBU2871093.1 cell envelope integrity protein TolA [Colwellia sp. E2M01]
MTKQTSPVNITKTNNAKAFWLSIALHVVLLIGLLSGDFASMPKPTPTPAPQTGEPIKAVVIDKAKLDHAINKIKKEKANQINAEQKRIKDAEKREADAKKRRAKEEARIKSLEAQRKKKEQEKIKADKAAKAAKVKADNAEKIRKQKEQEKQAAEEAAAAARSKRLKEEAAAKKAEEQRLEKIAEQKRQEKAAKEQAIQDAMLAEQMAVEMASRNQARQQQVMTEIQRYSALITQSINQRMIKDRSTMENKSCKLMLKLAPSGFVIDVKAGQGDKVVCDAATIAIGKAGNLPVSKDPEVFKEMSNLSVLVIPSF